MSQLISKIISIVLGSDERTKSVGTNTFWMFIIKIVNTGLGYLTIPLMIGYLGKYEYGVWITIYSTVGWFAFFDLGIGNGMRNKLAESIAKGEADKARTFVSTSYVITLIIALVLLLLYFAISPFVDATQVFNTEGVDPEMLASVLTITFTFFCLQFLLKQITFVAYGMQKPVINSVANLFTSVLTLVAVFALTKLTEGSMIYLAMAAMGVLWVVPFLFNVVLLGGKFSDVRPSFKFFNKEIAGSLMKLGGGFLVLQLASLVVFTTDHLLIAHLFEPGEVTGYHVAFKYFSLLSFGFTVLFTPLWSAYTKAFAEGDHGWIRKIVGRLSKLWMLGVVMGGLLLWASPYIYGWWVGEDVEISFTLSAMMLAYVMISTWSGIYGHFLFGVSKIRLQVWIAVLAGLANIPLSIVLAKYTELGTAAIMLATCICLFPDVILAPMQYRKIMSGSAKGIWNK